MVDAQDPRSSSPPNILTYGTGLVDNPALTGGPGTWIARQNVVQQDCPVNKKQGGLQVPPIDVRLFGLNDWPARFPGTLLAALGLAPPFVAAERIFGLHRRAVPAAHRRLRHGPPPLPGRARPAQPSFLSPSCIC